MPPQSAETGNTRGRSVIATIGHVDHGKTALVRALTGQDTDRLPDEKRRGISIELGYAELPNAPLSFVDVPGHERLVHAMIAGLGGVDVALLAVAADDGVMPQTREHLAICRFLGIRRVVACMTKVDLVDADLLELAREELTAELTKFGFTIVALLNTSVVSGSGIESLRELLMAQAQGQGKAPPNDRAWLAVDRAFSIKGSGTVATGTLTRGRLSRGASVTVVRSAHARSPEGRFVSQCRSLQIHGDFVEEAVAPCRVAVNLAQLAVEQVPRGSIITLDPDLPSAIRVDAFITSLPEAADQLKEDCPVTAHIGTDRAPARLHWLGDDLVHLTFERPLTAEGGVGLVLRGFSKSATTGAILGGGRVIDASPSRPPKRKDEKRRELRAKSLQSAHQGDLTGCLLALLELSAPKPLRPLELSTRFGFDASNIRDALAELPSQVCVQLPDSDAWIGTATLSDCRAAACAYLEEYHVQNRGEFGPSLESLRARLQRRTASVVAEHVVTQLIASGEIISAEGRATLRDAYTAAAAAASELDQALEACIEHKALLGATLDELAQELDQSATTLRAGLGRLSANSAMHRLGELWFGATALAQLAQTVTTTLRGQPQISVAEFKQLTGTTRKQAIVLLEYLDREQVTERSGDARVLAARLRER